VERNARFVFTGDNSGPIFVEFAHFFTGFPKVTERYADAVSQLTTEQKLAHMFPIESIGKECQGILACFGIGVQRCQKLLDESRQSNMERFRPWAAEYGFPRGCKSSVSCLDASRIRTAGYLLSRQSAMG
jgi:hypothetical protein